MPLHLNSITNDSQNSEPLAWMLQKGMDECDSVFGTEDNKYFHIRGNISDRISGQSVGRIVYTIFHTGKALEIKDLDIVWNNPTPTIIQFNKLRDGSSDSNNRVAVAVVELRRQFHAGDVFGSRDCVWRGAAVPQP